MEVNPNNFITDMVVFSHVHVFTPKADQSGNLKYSACLLLDKKNLAEKQKWDACVQAAIALGVKKNKFNAELAKANLLKLPIRDGDAEVKQGTKKPNQGWEGYWFINVNAQVKDPPDITKPSGGRAVPIVDQQEFYSGVIGKAIISFYAYSGDHGGKGVAVGFNGAIKAKDGKRLDGRVDAIDAFKDFAADMGDLEEPTEVETDVFGDEPGDDPFNGDDNALDN